MAKHLTDYVDAIMLITMPELQWVFGVRANGVLHVGAHDAEESDAYKHYNWAPVIWVEMLPEKFEALKNRFSGDRENTVLHAACWDASGTELSVFRASNDQSSSLLAPDLHLSVYPAISFLKDARIRTSRLDSILPSTVRFDFINFDIQGAELRALRGLGDHLEQVRWAYLEVNIRRLYKDSAIVEEVDGFMLERGFIRIATRMAGAEGWGDALYVNTRKISKPALLWLRIKASLWNAYCNARIRLRVNQEPK